MGETLRILGSADRRWLSISWSDGNGPHCCDVAVDPDDDDIQSYDVDGDLPDYARDTVLIAARDVYREAQCLATRGVNDAWDIDQRVTVEIGVSEVDEVDDYFTARAEDS